MVKVIFKLSNMKRRSWLLEEPEQKRLCRGKRCTKAFRWETAQGIQETERFSVRLSIVAKGRV